MSIIALALRIAAVRAVESAEILPEGRVFDSQFMPVDQIAEGALEPFLIVSTEKLTESPSGRDFQTGQREVEFVIELGLTKAIRVSVPDGEGRVELAMVETDAGLEASLALLDRQVMTCLFGRGGGAWGDVFRGLCSQVREVVSNRGVSAKDGMRFCARQSVLTLVPISEPPFASQINAKSPLAAFLTQAEADETTLPLARAIREAVEGVPQDWPAIYTATAVLGGYTEAEAASLGFALLEPDESPEPVVEIIIDGDERSMAVNADAVDAQLPGEAGG